MGNSSTIKGHENLSFSKRTRPDVNYVLRDKRHLSDKEFVYIIVDDTRYGIINYSPNGIAVEGDNKLRKEQQLFNVSLYIHGYHVRSLNLTKIRQHEIDDKTIIAFEVDGKPINFPQIDAAYHATSLVETHRNYIHSADDISPRLKAEVYEIKNWLEHLQWEIDQEELSLSLSGNRDAMDYETTFIPIIVNYLSNIIPSLYERIEKIINSLPEELYEKSHAFVLQNLNPIFHQAPFAERAFSKPLGYAGDYEMMNLIYRNENLGKTLFARSLHRFCIDTPAAQAVRNRANYLIEKLLNVYHSHSGEKPLNILSVACGPAKEWQFLTPQMDNAEKSVVIDLLDQDDNALSFTRGELDTINAHNQNPIQFNYINKAIKHIIARGLDEKEYDCIYSAGLFDYFSDNIARTTAEKLFKHLKPGGKLIIGNFDVGHDSQNIMDYIFHWPLIYRTKTDLLNLFDNIGSSTYIEAEELGINLFCIIEK